MSSRASGVSGDNWVLLYVLALQVGPDLVQKVFKDGPLVIVPFLHHNLLPPVLADTRGSEVVGLEEQEGNSSPSGDVQEPMVTVSGGGS